MPIKVPRAESIAAVLEACDGHYGRVIEERPRPPTFAVRVVHRQPSSPVRPPGDAPPWITQPQLDALRLADQVEAVESNGKWAIIPRGILAPAKISTDALAACVRRGRMDMHERASGWREFRWTLTDRGREVLAMVASGNEPQMRDEETVAQAREAHFRERPNCVAYDCPFWCTSRRLLAGRLTR